MSDQPDPNAPVTYAQFNWAYKNIMQQLDRLINNQADIYAKLHDLEDRLSETNALAQPAPTPKPPAQTQPNRPTPLASGNVVNEGRNLGLLAHKPKATETQPHDIYQVMADVYAFDGAEVRFYQNNMQYPEASMKLNDKTERLFTEVFGNWHPLKTEPGKHLPIVPGRQVCLTVQCTGPDRTTSKGNPYHNIVKAESVE